MKRSNRMTLGVKVVSADKMKDTMERLEMAKSEINS